MNPPSIRKSAYLWGFVSEFTAMPIYLARALGYTGAAGTLLGFSRWDTLLQIAPADGSGGKDRNRP